MASESADSGNGKSHPQADEDIQPTLDEEAQIELDEEAQRIARRLKQEAFQRQQERLDSEKIEARLNAIYNTLKQALNARKLDRQTQRELGILLQLTPSIRERNSLDILRQMETAISALLGTEALEEGGTIGEGKKQSGDRHPSAVPLDTSEVRPSTTNTFDSANSKLLRAINDFFFISEGRPENFIYAHKIRKNIQYQVSSQSSKSTYLIGGLATFLFLLGAVPLYFFYRSEPPVIRVRPKSLSEFEIVSGERQVRIIAEREDPDGGEDPEEYAEFISGEAPIVINFLDPAELESVIDDSAGEISEQIVSEVESSLTNELRRSVRRTIAQSLASAYATSEADVSLPENTVDSLTDSLATGLGAELDGVSRDELRGVLQDIRIEQSQLQELIQTALGISDPNTSNLQDFVTLLEDREVFPFEESAAAGTQFIDTASVREISRDAVEDALAAFPFDELTTLDTSTLTQGTAQTDGDGTTPSSGDASQDDLGLEDSLRDFGIDWRYLLIVIAGGAFGGSTFIILKAQNANTYVNEDRFSLFFTGLLKPVSGVALALFLFAALQSDALPVSLKTTQADNSKNIYLFFALSFVAGFSQLLVQDAISRTQSSVLPSAVRGPGTPSSGGPPP